ncbi:cytochrome P450, partial [Vibrio parahaemolyticus]
LTNAAIHTTSDLIGQSILNLCKYPDVIPHLREEVIQVLQKYGWQKVALTEVRLLDSFLKETQRFKPVGMVFMARKAT